MPTAARQRPPSHLPCSLPLSSLPSSRTPYRLPLNCCALAGVLFFLAATSVVRSGNLGAAARRHYRATAGNDGAAAGAADARASCTRVASAGHLHPGQPFVAGRQRHRRRRGRPRRARFNQLDLANQPLMRPGDVLEFIPGLLAEDHTGTVKANEYFLRGFFIDHGTDFSVWIDDVPYNMPNHPHLHGYLDINSMIPELVQTIDFKKGVYYPDAGDFSSAGNARITMVDSLPSGILKSEVGKDSYFRETVANSACLGQGTLLYAFSAEYFNGPWEYPENSRLFAGILRYTIGDDDNGFRLTALGLFRRRPHQRQHSHHRGGSRAPSTASARSIRSRASPRSAISSTPQWWHKDDEGESTKANLYYINYRFSIWTNTTRHRDLDDAEGNTGVSDEFQQYEHRNVYGGNLLADPAVAPVRRQRAEHLRRANPLRRHLRRSAPITPTPAICRPAGSGVHPGSQRRVLLPERGQVGDQGPHGRRLPRGLFPLGRGRLPDPAELRPARTPGCRSRKARLILGPWDKTEFYLNGGYGFHSNDARGIFNNDRRTSSSAGVLTPGQPADPIARSRGCEVGMKTQIIPNLTTTFALWYLHLQSELVFDPFGITSAGRRPRGEQSLRHRAVEHLSSQRLADVRLRLGGVAGPLHHRRIFDDALTPPAAPTCRRPSAIVFTAGPTVRLPSGYFAALQYKYLGPRDLTSDGLISSRATNWFNLGLGYENQRLTAGVNIINLMNSNGHEIDFANTDAVDINGQNYIGGTTGHPMQPFQARFYCNMRW